jgi:tripartite-type tricarboxylate transporter receptor subunit TctC
MPDGHTLLFASSTLWIGPLIRPTPYDALRDFAPVTLAISSPNVLVVTNSLPVISVPELIALARSKPGALNYASVGSGASSHLSMELFKAMAGVQIVRVAYKSGGAAHTALMGGETHMMTPSAGAILSHVKSGQLRALAVTSARPSVLVPELPTVASAGLPGFHAVAPFGFFAPAGTPAAIVQRLHEEIAQVLKTPEVSKRLLSAGVEVVAAPGAELAEMMRSERARLGKVIKDAGITED